MNDLRMSQLMFMHCVPILNSEGFRIQGVTESDVTITATDPQTIHHIVWNVTFGLRYTMERPCVGQSSQDSPADLTCPELGRQYVGSWTLRSCGAGSSVKSRKCSLYRALSYQ